MNKTTRNVLIIISSIALLFIGAVGYGVYKAYSFFILGGVLPDEIKTARILKGSAFLSKKELFTMHEQTIWKYSLNFK